MLELGFRTLSWLWSLHFFAPAAEQDPPSAAPWTVDLLLGADRQLTHIEHNLSRYFSPNTHLSGEALALYVAGTALPELAASRRRVEVGRAVLLQEIDRQINADGGHSELSTHYHRYSTEFYLLATLSARLAGDAAAPAFEEAARRQARYLRTMADDDGRLPGIGDDDGGQLFPICGREPADCRDTLSSAAVILDEPALAIGNAPEETWWFCGRPVAPNPAVTAAKSAALTASGYYVSRSAAGDHLVFDAGHHGFLNGGHAHADALSIVLSVAGRPFLVDAGTATYTMDPPARDRFRSTAIHNTIVLDGRPASRPRGPFHWESTAKARCVAWQSEARFDYVEGIHDGYSPKAHCRAVFAVHGLGWIVVDHLLGPATHPTTADVFWHIHPAWTPADAGCFRHADGSTCVMASSESLVVLGPEAADGLDGYAPAYGRIERATCLRAQVTAPLPTSVATFISGSTPLPVVTAVPVVEHPGAGWHAAAFRVEWPNRVLLVLSATEHAPESAGTLRIAAPWGPDGATTVGRAALIQLNGPDSDLPIVIDGNRP
jgi:hypothetical protein